GPAREPRAAMERHRAGRAGLDGSALSRQGRADRGVIATFAALAGRNYRFYWIGLVFYVLGHRAEYVTFAWLTWEVTHDPLALGYLGLAQGVPLVLFQLYGGVLADRIDRLRLLLVTQILTPPAPTAHCLLARRGQAG